MIMAEYYNKRQKKTAEARSKYNLNIVSASGRQKDNNSDDTIVTIKEEHQPLETQNVVFQVGEQYSKKHSLTLKNRKIQIGRW